MALVNELKTFVLLRGLSREQRHWGDFIPKLQEHFPGTNILTPDFPGNGKYFKQESLDTVSGMTDYLRNEVNKGLENPVIVIGLSMGAMVAADWLCRFPKECDAAVFLNTSFKGMSYFYERLRPENYLRLFNILISKNLVQREQSILKMTSTRQQNASPLIKDWVNYAEQYPVSRRNAVKQLLASSRFSAPKIKPIQPLLVLSGQQDRLVNPSCSRAIANDWQIPHYQHAYAGHDLTLDAPDWVCRQIKLWLLSPAG